MTGRDHNFLKSLHTIILPLWFRQFIVKLVHCTKDLI